jgi:hypothetical protein
VVSVTTGPSLKPANARGYTDTPQASLVKVLSNPVPARKVPRASQWYGASPPENVARQATYTTDCGQTHNVQYMYRK